MLKPIVFLFFLSFGWISLSQEKKSIDYYDSEQLERKSINEDNLSEFRDNEDFNYSEVVQDDSLWSNFMSWLRNILTKFWEAIFGVDSASGFIYFIFKILPYLLLGFLIFLLVKFFLRVSSNNSKRNLRSKGSVAISEEEQIIKNEDISELIIKAIKQNNFRLAIRYYYLLCLKKLTENETIEWQPQKTNSDYLNEIRKDELKTHFRQITKIYDYVWYGEFTVDALKFETLKLPFVSLQNEVKS